MARLPDMTADEDIAARIRRQLADRQVFELVTTVAAANMVSRLVGALDITSPAAGA